MLFRVSGTIRKTIFCDKGNAAQAHSRDRSFGVMLLFALVVEFCARTGQVNKYQRLRNLLLCIIPNFLNGLLFFFFFFVNALNYSSSMHSFLCT